MAKLKWIVLIVVSLVCCLCSCRGDMQVTTTSHSDVTSTSSDETKTEIPNLKKEKPEKVALDWVKKLFENIDDSDINNPDFYASQMQKYIQPKLFSVLHKQVKEKIGQNISCRVESVNKVDDYSQVIIELKAEIETLSMTVSLDPDNRILGFDFFPHINLAEIETGEALLIGDENPLPGVLLQPEGGSASLAIILPGSGPQDLNGTYGFVQPYKDIAEGLQKYGIATYRFDKRTYFYQGNIDTINLTVREEIINDALEIIGYFHDNRPEFTHIYLIGHSLSGYLLPIIYEDAIACGYNIEGLVYLGANASPLEDVMYDQIVRYVQDHGENAASSEEVRAVSEQRSQIKKLTEKDYNSNIFLLGLPAKYWLYFQNYNPVVSASNLDVKMFLLSEEKTKTYLLRKWKYGKKHKSKMQFFMNIRN